MFAFGSSSPATDDHAAGADAATRASRLDAHVSCAPTQSRGRNEEVIAETLSASAAEASLVSRVRLLEEYRDAKLGEGQKSMLWSIEYRAPDRTLTDVEVDRAHEAIVARLVETLPAQRR